MFDLGKACCMSFGFRLFPDLTTGWKKLHRNQKNHQRENNHCHGVTRNSTMAFSFCLSRLCSHKPPSYRKGMLQSFDSLSAVSTDILASANDLEEDVIMKLTFKKILDFADEKTPHGSELLRKRFCELLLQK